MSRARYALAAVVAVLLAAGLLNMPAGSVEPERLDAGSTACTTNADGFCRISHGLGAVPVSVVATVRAPVAGTWIALGVQADGYTALDFRVRVWRNDGTAWRTRSVTVAYVAAAGPPDVPTTAPAPTTPAATTAPPTSAAPTTSSPAPTAAPPPPTGWPDASTTGPTGALTVHSGNLTLSIPGQVVSDLDIRGCVSVRADNVTIRNSKVTCSGFYQISNFTSGPWTEFSGLLVEDVEIDCQMQLENKAIAFSGYTARRVHVHHCGDGFHASTDVLIEDSFIDLPVSSDDGPHYDGIQSDGGRNIRIDHNRIVNPQGQTAAILMSTNTAPIRDVWVTDNLLAGGGYTLYCGTGQGGVTVNFHATGNRWLRSPRAQWGPTTSCGSVAEWSDNQWIDGGAVPR